MSSGQHHESKLHGLFHHHDKSKQTTGTEVVQVGTAEVVQQVPIVAEVNRTQQTSQVVNEPTQVIRQENAAALAEERILRKEEQHLQPVITRDIEKTEVHQIAQPIHETQVLPTQQHQTVLAEQNIEQNFGRAVAPMAVPKAAVIEGEKVITQVEHAPIIQERVHTKVVEDIQPMIYREVIAPEVTTITKPIHERIVEAPVVIQQTASLIDRGTTTGVATTSYTTGSTTTDHHHKHTTEHSHKHGGNANYISGDYVNGQIPTGGNQIRAGEVGQGVIGTEQAVHQTFKGERLGQGTLIDQTSTTGSNFSTGQAK